MKLIRKMVCSSILVTTIVLLNGCGGDGIGGTGIGQNVTPNISKLGKLVRTDAATLNKIFQGAIQTRNESNEEPQSSDGENVDNDFSVNSTSLDTPRVSSTNIQEQGVDEADLIKTDGRYIFSVSKPSKIYNAASSSLTIAPPNADAPRSDEIRIMDTQGEFGFTQVKHFADANKNWDINGLYLHKTAKRLVALSSKYQDIYSNWFNSRNFLARKTELILIDVNSPASASLDKTIKFDGQLVDSRRNGDTLYMVLRHYPDYHYVDDNQLANTTTKDFLPTYQIGNAPRQFISKPEDCYIEKGQKNSGDIITLVAVDISAAQPVIKSQCYVGNVEAIYASQQSLYLATTRWNYQVENDRAIYQKDKVTTDIHKFKYTDLDFEYRGSGEIDGHLGYRQSSKSFRFSEANDELRVISYDEKIWDVLIDFLPADEDNEGQNTMDEADAVSAKSAITKASVQSRSPVVLSILKEDPETKSLKLISKLPNAKHLEPIGLEGEQLYATRFIGDRAYVVTFRMTDPLYVLDLSDSSDPFIAGELKVNGYSEILQPITETLLLGVGKDAVIAQGNSGVAGDGRGAWTQGLKLSLIDVSDAANPREVDKVIIGKRGTESTALYTHHGLTTLKVGEDYRIAFPVSLHEGEYSINNGDDAVTRFHQFKQLGLYRYKIDVASQQIKEVPAMVLNGLSTDYPQISHDRSVFINDDVYYMHMGKFWLQDWQGKNAVIGPK